MKKVILSMALILAFSAYGLYTRITSVAAPAIITPEPDKPNTPIMLPKYSTSDTHTTEIPKTTTPTPSPTTPSPVVNTGKFKNGSYTGKVADAYYGNVQVKAVISGGKISDVQFLDYPHDRSTSIRINSRAMPYLISEAISIQDSNVDTVSGASFTSRAFRESLGSALNQART